jgi:hypothetical protein
MNYTQVRIKPEYRDKLAALAARERRSMTRQLEVLIDQALKQEPQVEHAK